MTPAALNSGSVTVNMKSRDRFPVIDSVVSCLGYQSLRADAFFILGCHGHGAATWPCK